MYVLCLKAGHSMGMGHLFRMLNLYHVLLSRNHQAVLVLLDSDKSAIQWLSNVNIANESVESSNVGWEDELINRYSPDYWINDRLETSSTHAAKIKDYGINLVTFDDSGKGSEYADIHVAALAITQSRKAFGKKVLSGVEYLILSPEIMKYRRIRQSCEKLIVNLGGSDTYGMTISIINYLIKTNRQATIILGPGFQHDQYLPDETKKTITIKRSVPSLIAEFSDYDLAITGGGLTAFEAAASGLPTMTIANELHEIGNCKYLEQLNCSVYAGYLSECHLSKLESINNISEMSQSGINNISLNGADKIYQAIQSLSN